MLDRVLGLLLLRGHRCLVALNGEVSRVSLFPWHTLLGNLDLAWLQLRVRTGLNLKRNLRLPLDLLRSLGRLGADLDHLIHWLLNNSFGNARFARYGVDNITLDCHCLLPWLTLGHSLRRTSRHLRVKLDLHTEWNLRFNSFNALASGLGADADLGVCRCLRLLDSNTRLARRLTIHNFLRRSDNFLTRNTLFLNYLLTRRKRVIVNILDVKRNLLSLRAGQILILNTRTDLNDAWLRILRGLMLSNICLRTLGGELGGISLLTVFTFLHNPSLTRLQLRVLTNLSRERDRNHPRHVLSTFSRLCTNMHNLV